MQFPVFFTETDADVDEADDIGVFVVFRTAFQILNSETKTIFDWFH